MSTRITVRLTGDLGLDGAGLLLEDLERQTGLSWSAERRPDEGGHLDSGIAEVILIAVASRTAEMAYASVVDRVRDAVKTWRETHLDPPQVEVEAVEVEAAEPEPDPAPESEH
jgi:hypothetical protein